MPESRKCRGFSEMLARNRFLGGGTSPLAQLNASLAGEERRRGAWKMEIAVLAA
jgi:hypothetical protein